MTDSSTAATGDQPRPQGLLINGLHLAAISSFAIAWQYLDPLSKAPEFFLEHRFTGFDVFLLAVLLVVIPPVVLVLIEALAGLVSRGLRDALHLVFVGGLATLTAWQMLFDWKPTMAEAAIYPLALLIGALAALAYSRFVPVRMWLTWVSVAPLVVLVVFLAFTPTTPYVFGGDGPGPVRPTGARAPVVMVVLDEFPVTSLMDSRKQIDPVRYPNFARLAREATWYRNAASVGDYTKPGVPAILTGRIPKPRVLPIANKHPNNLFRLLGGSYHLEVMEWLTDLCTPPVCPVQQEPSRLVRLRSLFGDAAFAKIPVFPPGITFRLAGRVRPEDDSGPEAERPPVSKESVRRSPLLQQQDRVPYFARTIGRRSERALYFLHLILPHHAWTRLPSGQLYGAKGSPYELHPPGLWPKNANHTAVAFQRHLFQVAYVDTLLGKIIGRLKRMGVFDRALVVVTADHGVSFRPGVSTRTATRENIGDIAPVPLFVKAPGQRRGGVDDAYVETTDILPTVARDLRIRLPWRTDGEPASLVGKRRKTHTLQRESGEGPLTVTRRRLQTERDETLRRQLRLFGSGPRTRLFALGGHADLLGRGVRDLPSAPRAPVSLKPLSLLNQRNVDPSGSFVPAEVLGEVRSARPASRNIAVAVNGRIAATARTVVFRKREFYVAVCMPSAFRRGTDRISLYAIEGQGRTIRLAPMR